ncbi:RecBCD enzyme subunit RecD [Allorhodopirellula heiligendammensis]|uniref:RecBCD enzyme subunit RecD n=2 Tax=Allorhodopirellula heiligendammensis TaxID=2714739 RepID=A0A5C6C330_9BACT|nr:RecBCD enzyme subunit RecD [Allorhodopirellula heiligendammensis]
MHGLDSIADLSEPMDDLLRRDVGIYHPLLIQRVQLLFDPKIPEFTILDADHELELYSSLFQTISEVDPRKLGKCREELADSVLHPLDEEASAYLKRLAMTLSSKGELVEKRRPAVIHEQPVIGRSPVLFLRSRSIGLTSAIEQTITRLSQRDHFCEALNRIVGDKSMARIDEDLSEAEHEDRSARVRSEQTVLFGKKSNAEQLKIAQRLNQHGAVLVQGPPGTGKSHTIANLIGHLLAHGKSVLVTSHTTKALRVLRDHVVPDLQPLCVSVLDNDNTSRRQLEESVAVISSRLSESDVRTLQRESEEFAQQRERFLAARQRLVDTLFLARTNEYREIVFAGDSISPSNAAREVHWGVGEHDWIPGPVAAGVPMPLSVQEVSELYATNSTTAIHDEQFVEEPFPELASILTPQAFSTCVVSMRNAEQQQLHLAGRRYWGSTRFTTNHIQQSAQLADQFETCVADFMALELWQIAALEAGREGGSERQAWRLLQSKIAETVQFAAESKLDMLQHDPTIDDETPVGTQLAIAQQLVQHTSVSGKIGFWAGLTNRSWNDMIAKWKVRSGQPTESIHFLAISKRLRLQDSRESLAVLWDGLMHRNGSLAFAELGDRPEEYCEQFETGIETALARWQSSWGVSLEGLSGLGFDWDAFLANAPPTAGSFGTLKRIVGTVQGQLVPFLRSTNAALTSTYQHNRLKTLSSELQKFGRPEIGTLRAAIASKDIAAYEIAYQAIQVARTRQHNAIVRRRLLGKLDQVSGDGVSVAGAWAAAICDRDGVHGKSTPPGDPGKAWRWRQLDDEIQRRNDTDIEQLQQQIETTSAQIDRATVELIERRAWATQVKQAGAYQQDLVGWLDIVRRIGKGYGKRVARLQTEARLKMRNCRAAVPVWIMPISRLVDNFDFAKTKFDVVIIDEASQCDVMGLLAIALAKQVVVVGDHEQVSPSDVGQNAGQVDNLIKLHLDGIPNSVLYDGKMSIYDLARQSFGGLICLLEHFRCTTDIIQFSNYLSYNGEIKPLRDDAKFQQQVVEYRVESVSLRKHVNSAEADAIVSLIVAATEFAEYDGMTFGVIELVGKQQALEIEQQLRRRLSPEVYEARRVICGNSAQFQGDERDVMFLSMIDVPNGGPLTMKAAATFQQRYNVAASRAKNQMWVVHSLNPQTDLKAGDLRKRLIDHARDPKAVTRELEKAEARSESPFEEAVIKRLVAARFKVTPQWKVGRYRIDMVVQDGSRKLAVECDGDRYHGPEKMADDMNRQAILERLGWKFHRIRGTEFFRDPDSAMQRLFARFLELDIHPVADDQADTAETYDEELTQRLIRRAAEIRRSWDDPGADESPALLAFDTTQEQAVLTEDSDADDEFLVVTEPVEVAPPTISPPNSVTQSRQTVLTFTDLDDDESLETTSENSDVGLVSLDQFDGTEAEIIALLSAQPGLGAKQLATKLNLTKTEVNRVLYGPLSDHVACDEQYRWSLSVG